MRQVIYSRFVRNGFTKYIYIIHNKYKNKRLHVTVYGRRSAPAGAGTVVIVVVVCDGHSTGLRSARRLRLYLPYSRSLVYDDLKCSNTNFIIDRVCENFTHGLTQGHKQPLHGGCNFFSIPREPFIYYIIIIGVRM